MKETKHCEHSQSCLRLVVATEQLHAQSDALVPLPGEHAHVPGVERGLKDILLVRVVVDVALEKLQKKEQNHCLSEDVVKAWREAEKTKAETRCLLPSAAVN